MLSSLPHPPSLLQMRCLEKQPTPGRKAKKVKAKRSPWSGTAKMDTAFFHHRLTQKDPHGEAIGGGGILIGQHKPPWPPTLLSVASRGVLQTHLGDIEL